MGSSVSGAGRSGEEEQDGEESQAVPSFQNAFNEALLTASVSVLAAQSGEFVCTYRHACDEYMYLNSQYILERSSLLFALVSCSIRRQAGQQNC